MYSNFEYLFNDVNDLCRPPGDQCAEFEVEHITVHHSSPTELPVIPVASILLHYSGDEEVTLEVEGSTVSDCSSQIVMKLGTTVFIAANTKVRVTTFNDGVRLFRAHANLSVV